MVSISGGIQRRVSSWGLVGLGALLSVGLVQKLAAQEIPQVVDPALQLTLFADSSLIVHPIGIAFDQVGRLLVIESHTHFRPDHYEGPENDRVLCLEDTDGDGRADHSSVYFEGTQMTMDIAASADGSIYLATRERILRLEDGDGDGVADRQELVVQLHTEGVYPHNGLCGLALDHSGNLYFGLGENLGHDYVLRGSDGAEFSGGGEGGSAYWCRRDGTDLRRVATGFWNPFGMCVDHHGKVFATDNDPGGRPPNRLLHVVEGGDYGYQYRYGRDGNHVFQSWNGQLPGTLPMVAGLGEGACEVLSYLPQRQQGTAYAGLPVDWRGHLLVASWGDHRIERYQPEKVGASYRADRATVVVGGKNFRPVGLATAADGSLYISDWVRRSYPLHGEGNIWRLSAKQVLPEMPERVLPKDPITPESELVEAVDLIDPQTRHGPLVVLSAHEDPFVRNAAINRLAQVDLPSREPLAFRDPKIRIGVYLSMQKSGRSDRETIVTQMLADEDRDIHLAALKWISDERMEEKRAVLEALLDSGQADGALLEAALTARDRLDGKDTGDGERRRRLAGLLADPERPAGLRVNCLKLLIDKDIPFALLRDIVADRDEDPLLRLEAVRSLAGLGTEKAFELLAAVADDGNNAPALRRGAVLGLAAQAEQFQALLQRLHEDPAFRDLTAPALGLRERVSSWGEDRNAARMALFLHDLPGEPDIDKGRTVFFHPQLGNCSACHLADGHGRRFGPDLDRIGATEDPSRILASLLDPSETVATPYELWMVKTLDGQNRVGQLRTQNGGEQCYVDLAGDEFRVPLADLDHRQSIPGSPMPVLNLERFSATEVRDLWAFLRSLGRD